jgi:hypothetical protein
MCSLPLLTLQAATVRLINDSPFPLSALILAATGEVMGRSSLEPLGQFSWENSQVDTSKNSMSPFTVVFHCQTDGGVYGTVNNVTTGAMVQASLSSGSRYCSPKKQKKGEKQEKPSDLQYGPEPINPEQWRQQNRY